MAREMRSGFGKINLHWAATPVAPDNLTLALNDALDRTRKGALTDLGSSQGLYLKLL